jgi:ABC-type branched-subunit amino acid transport system permease subunit
MTWTPASAFALATALAFSLAMGQAGMLSFGHSAYYGLGAFVLTTFSSYGTLLEHRQADVIKSLKEPGGSSNDPEALLRRISELVQGSALPN